MQKYEYLTKCSLENSPANAATVLHQRTKQLSELKLFVHYMFSVLLYGIQACEIWLN